MYRVKEGIIGSAIGDALGTTTKGQAREYLLEHPVLKMTPCIKKGIPKGAWGDSTSLYGCYHTCYYKKRFRL